VEELGTIETPIVLTNTLSVAAAMEGVVAYTLAQEGNERVRSVNALVGETNDGGLSDIRGMHVTREHVLAAIRAAAGGPVQEGSVGAGTGTTCFGWKCGIGTSSRVLPARDGGYTVGVLVQTNYAGSLTIAGVPVGLELERGSPAGREPDPARPEPGGPAGNAYESCMIVVATDAPADARDLKRLAARAVFGLARTGSSYQNGSGDYAIAFTTSPELRMGSGGTGDSAPRQRSILPSQAMSPLFRAVLEATEEAVYNSLLRATTVTSRVGTAEAIPIERVREILRKHGITAPSRGAR
jgi:D-aminopeptidase